MSTTNDWFNRGREGLDAPKDYSSDAYDAYQAGRTQRELDKKVDYALTHPDDPLGEKDPFKSA